MIQAQCFHWGFTMRRLLLATIVGLTCSSAGLAEKPLSGLFSGFGMCAQFNEEYRKDPQHTIMIWGSWAVGFMSGANTLAASTKMSSFQHLEAKPPEEMLLYLRRYCSAHPQKSFGEAVITFYATLPSKPMPSNP